MRYKALSMRNSVSYDAVMQCSHGRDIITYLGKLLCNYKKKQVTL